MINHFQLRLLALEYFEIIDEKTLMPAISINKDQKLRSVIAAFVDSVRLIDTISLEQV